MIDQNQKWIGIDLSQNKINVHVKPDNRSFQVDNNQKGISNLVNKLIPIKPESIVVKRAQGQEANLTNTLLLSAFTVVVIHSDHAKRLLLETNTKTIDIDINAQDLANLAPNIELTTTNLSKQIKKQLSSLASLDDQLKEMLVEEKIKLENISDASKDSLFKHVGWLEEQLTDNNQKLELIIDKIENQQQVTIKQSGQQVNRNSSSRKAPTNNSQKVTKSYRGQSYEVDKTQETPIYQQLNQAIPTKKITKHYRGQSYEVEVPDYEALARMKRGQ